MTVGFPDLFKDAARNIRDVLGEDVQYSPKSGEPTFTLRGKFENDFLLQSVNDGVGIESRAPVFEFRTLDYPSAIHGDKLTKQGSTYAVVGIQPTQDFTALILELQ